MPPLPDEQIAERLNQLAGWERRGDEITKTFELATFPAAIQFVGRVAERAEAANHHPDIDIRYRKVRLALTTHDQGGISDLDFALAEEIEVAADEAGSERMITAVVAAILLVLVFAVVIAIAKDRGPGPDDVAVSYEYAWDRLDFDSVFTLSGRELRDGLDHHQFVAAKRTAYEHQRALAGLVDRVGVDEVATGHDLALVITRVELRDGSIAHHRVELARRSARWEVVAYRLTPSAEDTTTAN